MFGSKTFTQLLQDWAAAVQGAASVLLDFTVGSILRAISQAQGGVGLWLQYLIMQLLVTTRLATAVAAAGANNAVVPGGPVATFVADFGLTPLPPVASSGGVTFARYTPTNAATVLVGNLLQTTDGSQTFMVVADTSQAAYNATLGAYVIPAGQWSITATVQALVGGTGGNISAGTLTFIQTGIDGVDTVTNPNAFTNGVAAETNGAIQVRFVAFINSLSKGTVAALQFAVANLQQGMQSLPIENWDYNGSVDNGMVTVIVDNGSGNCPAALVTAAQNALNGVRAAGIRVDAFAATLLGASVVMSIGVAAGFNASVVQAAVIAALTTFINSMTIGQTLSYVQLGQVAYNVPGVASVAAGYTLNGAVVDVAATDLQTIKVGTAPQVSLI